ncbi:MAG: amidohydrolase family protein [Anaerolineae bacterium]|nr:amidohydrolase family protein [Anaerolineae bacterium]
MIGGVLAVDAHCHIGAHGGRCPGLRSFTAEDLLARMDSTGMDHAVVCHFISSLWSDHDVSRGNDLVIEATRRYPDRLTGVAVVNPRMGPPALEELRRCLEAGLKGVKLQPILHGYYPIDGALVDPLMEVAAEAQAVVSIHSDFGAWCCTPYQVVRLAARHPGVTVVMLHMGIVEAMLMQVPDIVRATSNVLIETSQTPDSPYAVYVNSARQLGPERILFGSDGPIISDEVNLAKLEVAVRQYGLTGDEKRAILGANAARVFRIA